MAQAAGVIEDGEWSSTETGTAQGASVSPLLSNVYLHYVFDLWADQWRRRNARGDVILVRFADDYVAGFQHREDAERFLADLRDRFAKFGLELHPEKTRLIEFGRFAARDRERRGDRKPETFEFLGFTHICAKDRHGRFKLRRVTSKKRMRAKLRSVKTEMRRRMHHPIPEQGRWLARVLQGHYNYYAVPDNSEALHGVPTTGDPALAPGAAAPQPERPPHLEAHAPPRRSMATRTPHPSSLAQPSASTPKPKGGAQCVDAHAGICAGGRQQRRSLPRSPPAPAPDALIGCPERAVVDPLREGGVRTETLHGPPTVRHGMHAKVTTRGVHARRRHALSHWDLCGNGSRMGGRCAARDRCRHVSVNLTRAPRGRPSRGVGAAVA